MRAGSSPPTKLATAEICGSPVIRFKSLERMPGGRFTARGRLMSRTTTCSSFNCRPTWRAARSPWSSSNRATPEPTVPKPTKATLTCSYYRAASTGRIESTIVESTRRERQGAATDAASTRVMNLMPGDVHVETEAESDNKEHKDGQRASGLGDSLFGDGSHTCDCAQDSTKKRAQCGPSVPVANLVFPHTGRNQRHFQDSRCDAKQRHRHAHPSQRKLEWLADHLTILPPRELYSSARSGAGSLFHQRNNPEAGRMPGRRNAAAPIHVRRGAVAIPIVIVVVELERQAELGAECRHDAKLAPGDSQLVSAAARGSA